MGRIIRENGVGKDKHTLHKSFKELKSTRIRMFKIKI